MTNRVILSSILLLTAGLNAKADVMLNCKDSAGPNSYEVQFFNAPKDTGIAKILLNSKLQTQLDCRELELGTMADGSGQPIAECHETGLADAGYSMILTDGDSKGVQHAVLSEVSFVGTKEIANLPCAVVWTE